MFRFINILFTLWDFILHPITITIHPFYRTDNSNDTTNGNIIIKNCVRVYCVLHTLIDVIMDHKWMIMGELDWRSLTPTHGNKTFLDGV